MKRKGQVTYELTEQEFKEIRRLSEDVKDYFEDFNDRRDAVFSIKRIINILDNSEE